MGNFIIFIFSAFFLIGCNKSQPAPAQKCDRIKYDCNEGQESLVTVPAEVQGSWVSENPIYNGPMTYIQQVSFSSSDLTFVQTCRRNDGLTLYVSVNIPVEKSMALSFLKLGAGGYKREYSSGVICSVNIPSGSWQYSVVSGVLLLIQPDTNEQLKFIRLN